MQISGPSRKAVHGGNRIGILLLAQSQHCLPRSQARGMPNAPMSRPHRRRIVLLGPMKNLDMPLACQVQQHQQAPPLVSSFHGQQYTANDTSLECQYVGALLPALASHFCNTYIPKSRTSSSPAKVESRLPTSALLRSSRIGQCHKT